MNRLSDEQRGRLMERVGTMPTHLPAPGRAEWLEVLTDEIKIVTGIVTQTARLNKRWSFDASLHLSELIELKLEVATWEEPFTVQQIFKIADTLAVGDGIKPWMNYEQGEQA